MTHVGVKRLAAGNREKHPTQDQECKAGFLEQHANAVEGVEGVEYFEIVSDVDQTQAADNDEPDRCHRRKERRNAGCPMMLKQKQRDEDHKRERDDKRLEVRIDDREALDRRYDGYRRRDHPVAKAEGGPDDADAQYEAALPREHGL